MKRIFFLFILYKLNKDGFYIDKFSLTDENCLKNTRFVKINIFKA